MSEAVDTVGNNDAEKSKPGVGNFIAETREELRRTSFPSSDDVRNTTVIVIINVIFFAAFLYVIDLGWTYGLQGLEWLIKQIAGI